MTPPAAATTAGRSRSTVRRSPAPRVPRRVSGPARRPKVAPAPRREPLGARLGAWVRELPDARLLDRLIRGRAWIVLVGILLMGVVAMQVSMLKLNAGIGRAVETTNTLERKTSAMRLSVSRLSSGERIQAAASRIGMVMPAPGDVRYLGVREGRDPQAAVITMRVPKTQAQQLAATGVTTTQAPSSTIGSSPTDPIAPAKDPLPAQQPQQGAVAPAAGTGGTATTQQQETAAPQQQTAAPQQQTVAPQQGSGGTSAPQP